MAAHDSRFLRACRREPVDTTPIWLMRQAGRYMPEYRALREKHAFLEMVQTPELAATITLQPMKAFDLDAAIIFADILPPLQGMGLNLSFEAGEGPVIHNPVRDRMDVAALRVLPPEETLGFTLDAIRLARKELGPAGKPLIGFSGAPFTLAAYAIEGGGSNNHALTRSFMMSDPAAWHGLMEKLAQVIGEYLLAQARAGADVLQLFDSWVGVVSPADYRELVMPYTKAALEIAKRGGVPLIHFGTDTGGILELVRDAGGDVIGVDWRMALDVAWRRLGDGVAIQGNLDPAALLAPWDELKRRARRVLDEARSVGRPGYIFNLGHGILQQTPVDNVRRLVEYVHEYGARGMNAGAQEAAN